MKFNILRSFNTFRSKVRTGLTSSYDQFKPYYHFIIFGLIFAITPLLQIYDLIDYSTVTTFSTIIIYAVAALGLNILLGYSGLISLATAGFMAIGSYGTGIITEVYGLSFGVSLLLTMTVPLILGLIVGIISLRIEGYYLAIATLAVSEIIKRFIQGFDELTNGNSGFMGADFVVFGFELGREFTYLLLLGVLVIVMIISYNLINSETGRAFLTMKGSEPAAQAMGINILKYRLIAFGVATLFATLAGNLEMYFFEKTNPNNFAIAVSLDILAIIIIGGLRSIFGTVIGAFVVIGVPELILKQLPVIGDINGLAYILKGVLIIVVILFYPNGLVFIWNDIKRIYNSEGVQKIVNKFKKKGVQGE